MLQRWTRVEKKEVLIKKKKALVVKNKQTIQSESFNFDSTM